MSRIRIGTQGLLGLLLAFTLSVSLFAQDDAEKTEPAEKKPYDVNPAKDKPLTLAEQRAKAEREKLLKYDYELRYRLQNTVWNDLDILAGQPGQVWMLNARQRPGEKADRAWYLNDTKGLPRVGSWEVKNGEILLTAMNGTLIGRGKFADNEITGTFISADLHREYGQFRLREETKRNYRVLSMRDPNPPRRRK